MATNWSTVSNSEAFRAAPPEEQEAVRVDFFEKVIAPQVKANGDDIEAVRADFMSTTLPYQTAPKPEVKEQVAAPEESGERVYTAEELKRGTPDYKGFGSGAINAVKEMVSGGDRAKGTGAGLDTIWNAKEMTATPITEAFEGDTLDEMLGNLKSTLKNNASIATNSIFGGDADAISLARQKGAKISEDDKGNIIATFPSGSYIINKPGLDATDIGKGIAQAAPMAGAAAATGGLTAAIPSLMGRVGAMAGVDMAADKLMGEAVEAAGGQDHTTERSLQTGAMSAATNLIAPGVGRMANAVFGKGPKMSESAKELIDAADSMGVPLRTTELARAGEFGPPTRVGNAGLYVSDILSGPSKGVAALQESSDKLPSMLKMDADVAAYSDDALVGAFAAGKQKRVKEAGDVFESVKKEMGDQAIPLNNTIREIDITLDKWQKPGSTVDASDIKQLKTYRDMLESGPQDLTMLRDNRTALRQEMGSAMNKQMGKDRMEKAGKKIYDAMTQDMHEGVEAYAKGSAQALKNADAEWASLMGDLGAPKVALAIKNGDINPEYIRENMTKFGSQDINRIDRLLDDNGRKTLRTAIAKNLDDSMRGGSDEITPANFTKAYDKHEALIKKFYSENDAKMLQGIRRLMETSKGMKLASTNITNGSILLPYIVGGAAVSNPAAVAAGYVANRTFNSIPVRNALLKIAATKPSNMAYNKHINTLESALASQRDKEDRQKK